ncbi:DUF4251 domain-containing protein [Snuella sedimenti]|uniref:DUF4251 domain-containing protein n=1 Tax=Snuella sedimenti TaxID=2798802 RepID=A0A8J7LPB4_9FLAO|nr:DUF4251 domain-containing protein [Snuella sedimenti]MBJ6369249.1 DUF4251 domain-containing protein [Snuella sedimenti]
MKARVFFLIILFIGLWTCGPGKAITPDQRATLDKTVSQRNFTIEVNAVYPQTTSSMQQLFNAGLFPRGSNPSRIDVNSGGYYLKMLKDSVDVFLPFYGERHFGGGYNPTNTGIQFRSAIKNLSVSKTKKSHGYTLRFDTSKSTEAYQIQINLNTGKTANILVNSMSRTGIMYTGNIVSKSTTSE